MTLSPGLPRFFQGDRPRTIFVNNDQVNGEGLGSEARSRVPGANGGRRGTAALRMRQSMILLGIYSHDFRVFAIEFWPAWLSPRMRLSSPDHSPLIARTRVLAIFSSCRFSSYNTASGRFYQPGETFMTHLTYSGLCCFFFFKN